MAALREAGGDIRGIFAQQSIREMTRTQRSPEAVMQAAVDALTALDYQQPWSADADHLKTAEDVKSTAAAGFVFFTLDPSDDVDQQADSYDAATLAEKFAAARELAPWLDEYQGRTVRLPSGPIEFDEPTLPARGRQVRQGDQARHRAGQDRRGGVESGRPSVRDRAERRRNGPADDAGRALHHRRPVRPRRASAWRAWRRGSSATSRRASTTRATWRRSKRR